MALVIVATPGAATANSFVTGAEAVTYLESRLNAAAWTGITDTTNRALVEATRELSLLSYVGDRTDAVQVLSWPRNYAPDPDYPKAIPGLNYPDLGLVVTYYANTIIPVRIKNATIELALEFLKAGTTDLAAQDANQNVIRKRVDVLETEYSEPLYRKTGLGRFPRIVSMIEPLLDVVQSSGGLEILRT